MENKLPTAEEFLNNNRCFDEVDNTHIKEVMVKFAKLHVKSALKEASEKVYFRDFNDNISYSEENKYSILNAYPLTNIK